MSRAIRSSLAKFRCWVVALRIEQDAMKWILMIRETVLIVDSITKVENEEHVLLECPLYIDIRLELFSKTALPSHVFDALSNPEKVCHLNYQLQCQSLPWYFKWTTKLPVLFSLKCIFFCFISFTWSVNNRLSASYRFKIKNSLL